MSNSFQLPSYSVTLNSTSSSNYTYVAPTVTVVAGGTGSVHVGGSYTTDYMSTWEMPKEWEDCFPEWAHVQEMCEEYPGLKIAFEKFRTTYKLLKDDYVSKKSQK